MTAVLLRDAIVTTLKAELADLRTVEVYGGAFTLEELMRQTVRPPAVFVTIAGTSAARRAPGDDGFRKSVRIGCYVLTAAKPGLSRHDAAAIVAEQIEGLAVGPNSVWGLDWVQKPDSDTVQSQNLYAPALDRKGNALWGVRWEQEIHVQDINPDTLTAFAGANVDWFLDGDAPDTYGDPNADPDKQDEIDV